MTYPGRHVLTAAALAALFALMPATSFATPGDAAISDRDIEEASPSGAYLAGRAASRQRDNAIAARFIARALESDPGNPLLIERAFMLELSAGNMDNAERFAQEVIAFNDQHRQARLVLALKEVRAGKPSVARDHLAKSAYTPVGELTAALLSGWTYMMDGNLNMALHELDKLKQNQAFENFRLFHGALMADLANVPNRAEVFYQQAYEQAGSSLRVVQAYGSYLQRTGRPDKAREIYELFIRTNSGSALIEDALAKLKAGAEPEPLVSSPAEGMAEALYSLAGALTDERSIDVALMYAQLALVMRPDFPVGQTLLAEIYSQMKLTEKSIEAYKAVTGDGVLRSSAEIQMANGYNTLKKLDEAVAILKGLIAREPGNYDALLALGNIYRVNEKWTEAADAYTRALARLDTIGPDQWVVYYFRGIAYERAGQWANAEPDFRTALRFKPDQPAVLNYLGYSLIEKRLNLPEAFAMVEKAVSLSPNDGYIVDSLGWGHYQLGRYDEAVKHLERAVELKPGDAVINEHLGDAYWRVGRHLEAKFQWQYALDSNPAEKDIAKIREKIEKGLAEIPENAPATAATVDPNKS